MRLRMLISRLWAGHRAMAIAIPAVVLVAVLAGGLVAVSASGGFAQATPTAAPTPTATPAPTDTPEPTPEPTAVPVPTPTPFPSGMAYAQLDGVLTTAALANRLPMAVMIDNQVAARPQSGISAASIVYQAPADGNQDRYMMIFQEGTAPDIGPVRSARPYFVYWAAEYKALYGHFGGDAQALQVVIPANAGNIYNEDALNGGSCPYHRISTRVAPYNAYTNSAALIGCLAARGFPATYGNLPTRAFVDDTPATQRPTAQSVTIPYLAETISYQFDASTDSYLRLVGGQRQIDPAGNQQVVARNIVVMFQTYSIVPSLDKLRPVVANVGSGKAIVFEEGRAITGTWKKTSNTALTLLYDDAGNVIPLVRGEIFMQSVPVGAAVTYK